MQDPGPAPRSTRRCVYGFAPLRHGRPHLCCHFALPRRGPGIPPGGSPLRSAPLLGPRFRGENEAKRSFHCKCAARPLPVATPVLPRQGLGAEGRDAGDPERKLAQGLAWAPRAGRGLSRGAAGGTVTWTAGMRRSGPVRGARQLPVRAARTHHATAPERTDRRAGAAPCASSWSAAGREGNAASVAQGRRAASEARGPKDRRGRAARTCGGRRPHRADGGSNPVLPPTHTVASGRSLPYPPSILTGRVAAAKHLREHRVPMDGPCGGPGQAGVNGEAWAGRAGAGEGPGERAASRTSTRGDLPPLTPRLPAQSPAWSTCHANLSGSECHTRARA